MKETTGISLVVQWLGLHALTAEGPGVQSLLGELNPTSHEAWQKKKLKT